MIGPPPRPKEVRTMTSFDRRRFLEVASATGVAAAVSPGAALARGLNERKPNLIGVHADNGARVVAQHVLDRRTVDITIDSMALGHTASVRILLPNRFASHSSGAWPVLYLLHGGFGSYVDWTESSDIANLARKRDVQRIAESIRRRLAARSHGEREARLAGSEIARERGCDGASAEDTPTDFSALFRSHGPNPTVAKIFPELSRIARV
jgi:hypothetical protein